MSSLLKKNANNYNNEEILLEIHEKAKKTLEKLTKNMITGEVSLDRIFEFYSAITRINTIKLLLRSRKMYEARIDVKTILILLINREVSVQLFHVVWL